ncbi:MAG: biosynthetic-type acetolactate synthase large subunit [Clostridiales bacterium]|jgi:acetolactate synthase-1/2/3 large subunit|nr:biosynthetic-type acetolactate synthase large subunit [Clostridiales bacterium]
MLMNGSEILIECLKEQGVDVIFGYPGGTVLNIYDALYKQDKIKHYLTSHEQNAAHAADGYARSTGKVGVCIATSGPGATNLVTGIATAYMDSVPLVAITGNVALPALGKDSFQEIDITGVTMPITKYGIIVKDISELAECVRKAFYIAKEGRPGPVLIDITKDVTAAMYEYEPAVPKPIVRRKNIKESAVETAVKMIDESKQPLILAGGGVVASEAGNELALLAEKIDSPVCVSAMGIGVYPSSSERFTGMIGMHGTKASNVAATESDLIIAIGARFSDRVISNAKKFATKAKILHIDIDAAEINKNIVVHASVIGDAKEILTKLLEKVKTAKHSEWTEHIKSVKNKYPLVPVCDDVLRPQHILSRVSEIAKDAIVVTEVGQHQMWACHYIQRTSPRTFLSSGGLGTMGYGLGAAIGAKVANPQKVVINIAGDGCFRMNNIELATAVEYDLPVITIILNNHTLGMVRQWQTLFYEKRYSHSTLTGRNVDFVKLAESYGAVGFNVTLPEQFDDVLKKAISLNKTAVINCEIDIDEKVFPMVSIGKGIDEVMLAES